MSRVIHFEIQAENPEQLAKFYEEVLGWKIQKWNGPVDYWLVTTGPDEQHGINGAIMPKGFGGGVINTVVVPSVDEYIKKTKEAGGKVIMPKRAVPGVGYMAYCADSEGNIFGMIQNDPFAK